MCSMQTLYTMKNTLSYPHRLINALKLMFFLSSITGNTTCVIGQIPSMPPNILQYHQLINLAELAIINDNYTEAINQYNNAFHILPGFLPDRYNAILLTKQKYDAEFLYDCADYFFQRGVCLEFFAQFPELNLDIVTRPRNAQRFKPLRNMAFVHLIDSIYAVNMQIRDVTPFDQDKIAPSDAANYAVFKKYIARYGFPSEDIIGTDCEIEKNEVTSRVLLHLLNHFSQGTQVGLDSILLDAVSTGKLKPEYYADYINFYGIETASVPNTPVAVVNNEKYILIANDSLLASANQLRAKVGLSSVQEQLLKIRFREKFPQSPYMLPVTRGIVNLTGFPEGALQKILEKGRKY